MKKYFTKFLPVDGEIKEGDMFLWKDEVHKFHSDVGYGMKTYTQYNEKDGSSLIVNWSNCKGKVKLFLCTRDIQVGNKIYLTESDKYEIFKYQRPDGRIICESDKINEFPKEIGKQDYFKVIGEISPEAIWVKEGDEFGEDEVRFALYGPDPDDIDGESLTLDEFLRIKTLSTYQAKVIEIKGPCGHFH